MEKTWDSLDRRQLVVLVGLCAEAWEERIPYEHIRDLPEGASDHPDKIIEGIYGLSLTVRNGVIPCVLVTNRLEAIYTLNNCTMAFGLGNIEIPGILNSELRLNPKNIIAYLCDSETEEPVCISDPKTGWINEEPLGKYGEQLHEDLNRISNQLELMKGRP